MLIGCHMKLKEALNRDGLLKISLNALKAVLSKSLGVKFYITLDERVKSSIKDDFPAEVRQIKQAPYPYGSLIVQDIALRKDYVVSPRAMQRFGIHLRDRNSRATTGKVFAFPARIGIELHLSVGDSGEALLMSQVLLMLAASQNLHLHISYGDLSFGTLFEFPENLSIPMADTGNAQEPGYELVMAFSMTTYIGFIRNVAAVQTPPSIRVQVRAADSLLDTMEAEND